MSEICFITHNVTRVGEITPSHQRHGAGDITVSHQFTRTSIPHPLSASHAEAASRGRAEGVARGGLLFYATSNREGPRGPASRTA